MSDKVMPNQDKLMKFEVFGVVGRTDSSQAISSLEALCDFLLSKKQKILLNHETANALGNFNGKVEVEDIDVLCQKVDIIIVVGGDGTLLSFGRVAAKHSTPLLGINRGKLGFLADINPQSLEASLSEIIKGHFLLDKRFLLEASVGKKAVGEAVNDIVLSSSSAASMVEYELYVDSKFVYSQAADGLIISTPTGSTAYALSGGGPIMHPDMDAIVLVPICPHTLSSRPMVIDGNSEVRIVPNYVSNYDARTFPQIACDGREAGVLDKGLQLKIKKSANALHLLHPNTHEFYDACRSKLGWGKQFS